MSAPVFHVGAPGGKAGRVFQDDAIHCHPGMDRAALCAFAAGAVQHAGFWKQSSGSRQQLKLTDDEAVELR